MERVKVRLSGAGGWVWYVERNGGARGIIEKAKAAGLSFVLIKGGDGPAPWAQLTPELVAELKAAGLRVLAWAYCYGGHRPGTAHGERQWGVSDEIAVAEWCLEQGVDGFVADVEAEYEGRWREAGEYVASVASNCRTRGALFGYAPLPVIDYHTRLPYLQFNESCDVVMPQFYSRALGSSWLAERLFEIWERWRASWQEWSAVTPELMPIGECFGAAGSAEIRAFRAACRTRGCRAVSYWSMDEMDAAEMAAIAGEDGEEAEWKARVEDALHGIWHESERVAAAVLETQRKVDQVKQAVGL